ncbi:ROK family transcriptional regulator [Pseudovibrio flavus]|uniref:ROK family transcriptional regulator n=1 Tax=Pseudovibrio flavus TaxID=2529854 RepID=UPI00211BA4AD|nr:ROK family protein [Pseudovibrio flavus]
MKSNLGNSPALDIFNLVLQGKANSRRDIAKILSMRPNTVSDCVSHLVEKGIVWEHTEKGGGRGRPVVTLAPNANKFLCIFIQIIGLSAVVTNINIAGQELWSQTSELPAESSTADILEAFKKLHQQALQQVPSQSTVAALVFSLGGILDIKNKVWQFSSRWPNMQDLDLKQVHGAAPYSLHLYKNINLELSAHDLKRTGNEETTLLVHWGQGIGCAVSPTPAETNQNAGRFGEIGHWKLSRTANARCHCGNAGCVETIAALWALQPHLKAKWPDIADDELTIAPDLQSLDLLGLPVFTDALNAVSNVITNLNFLLFPQTILVSGPFVQNPFVWAELNRTFLKDAMISGVDTPKLQVATRSSELERLGALGKIMPDVLFRHLSEIRQDPG